jgi:hypothetical protein
VSIIKKLFLQRFSGLRTRPVRIALRAAEPQPATTARPDYTSASALKRVDRIRWYINHDEGERLPDGGLTSPREPSV